jgi:hypothetical protein
VSFDFYARTRSARVTVTTPEGSKVRVENMRNDDGLFFSFEAVRTMDEDPGTLEIEISNLPPDVLALLKNAQALQIDDADAVLANVLAGLQTAVVAPDGSDGLAAGCLVVEVEAGYDGAVSRVFRAVGATARTSRPDDLTTITRFSAVENLDGVLLGLPLQTWDAGTPVWQVVDDLRKLAGLDSGNLSAATFAAICGEAKLDSPYHASGGEALRRIKSVLEYLPVRWLVDDRNIWICGRDTIPNAGGVPPYLQDERFDLPPILAIPERTEAGQLQVSCLLAPYLRPGRLANLTPGGLGAFAQGLSPELAAVVRADVPPGPYRIDQVTHRGEAEGGEWTSTVLLRPVKVAGG